jgi:hypothetical protein
MTTRGAAIGSIEFELLELTLDHNKSPSALILVNPMVETAIVDAENSENVTLFATTHTLTKDRPINNRKGRSYTNCVRQMSYVRIHSMVHTCSCPGVSEPLPAPSGADVSAVPSGLPRATRTTRSTRNPPSYFDLLRTCAHRRDAAPLPT